MLLRRDLDSRFRALKIEALPLGTVRSSFSDGSAPAVVEPRDSPRGPRIAAADDTWLSVYLIGSTNFLITIFFLIVGYCPRSILVYNRSNRQSKSRRELRAISAGTDAELS